jgi:hypothetical protein
MSDMRIRSGSGNGLVAHVTSDNLLQVQARTESQQDHEIEQGNAYNVNPGVINLSGTTESGLIYLKNTGEDPIVVPAGIYMFASTDASSGYWRFRIVGGTGLGGTLISGGTDITPVNRLMGSSDTLTATCKYGAHASTVTGGETKVESILPYTTLGRTVVGVQLEIPKGGEIALLVTAPTGNTSANVMVAIAPYVRTSDE